MNQDIAKDLFAACERTLAELTAAEQVILRISDAEERSLLLRGLGGTIGEVLEKLRAPVLRQYPALEPAVELGEPDTVLDDASLNVVSQLTSDDIAHIDRALLAECAPSWRKVARVVGAAMSSLKTQFPGLPDGYYAQRVVALVHAANLESQGNLQYMRFSEVRLPQR
jgi:hypothetical protein